MSKSNTTTWTCTPNASQLVSPKYDKPRYLKHHVIIIVVRNHTMETKTSNPKKTKHRHIIVIMTNPVLKRSKSQTKLNLKRVPLIKANGSPALNACKAIAYGTWFTTGSTIFFIALLGSNTMGANHQSTFQNVSSCSSWWITCVKWLVFYEGASSYGKKTHF